MILWLSLPTTQTGSSGLRNYGLWSWQRNGVPIRCRFLMVSYSDRTEFLRCIHPSRNPAVTTQTPLDDMFNDGFIDVDTLELLRHLLFFTLKVYWLPHFLLHSNSPGSKRRVRLGTRQYLSPLSYYGARLFLSQPVQTAVG